MERVSRVFMNDSCLKKLSGKLLRLGIKPKVSKVAGAGGVFLVSENHPNFLEAMKIARDNELFPLAEAKFSPRDYKMASHFTLFGMPRTFPSPSAGFLDRTTTYDTRETCRTCGIGRKQIGPFRFEREVKVKDRQVMGLHWIFDEVFVGLSLVSEVFARFGIETREVLNSNGKRVLSDVRHVVVPEVYVPIDVAELKVLKCSMCSSEKYEPRRDIFFPRLIQATDAPIFKTKQYIGSGAEAFRQIIISKAVYDALMAAKAKSAIIDPVAA